MDQLPAKFCAELLGVNDHTFRQWRNRGYLDPGVKMWGPADFLSFWLCLGWRRAGLNWVECQDRVQAAWPAVERALKDMAAGKIWPTGEHRFSEYLIEARPVDLRNMGSGEPERLYCKSRGERDHELAKLLEPIKGDMLVHVHVGVFALTVALHIGLTKWAEAVEKHRAQLAAPKPVREKIDA